MSTDQAVKPPPPIQWRIPDWFKDLDSTALERLKMFHVELLRFNAATNLISPKSESEADDIHFSDSILAARMIRERLKGNKPTVWDFGSGNGFPGLVIAILYPDVKIVCLDSDGRKIEFLKFVKNALKLENIDVHSGRLEDLEDEEIEFAVCRAFAPMDKSLLWARRAMAAGSLFFHLKGPEWSTEIARIQSQVMAFWKPTVLGTYKLPGSGQEKTLILCSKLK